MLVVETGTITLILHTEFCFKQFFSQYNGLFIHSDQLNWKYMNFMLDEKAVKAENIA